MLHLFLGKEPWFRAKRYGIGAAFPIRWQGWVLLASYTLALAGIGRFAAIPGGIAQVAAFLVFVGVTVAFVIIVRKRTEGGWKWRWGSRK